MAEQLTFYDGRDDDRFLQLQEDGANLPQSGYDALTSVELLCRDPDGETTLLSSGTAEHRISIDGANQRVVLELGLVDALAIGTYEARVIGYTSGDPNGLVYADFRDLRIVKHA